ncbi:hypothetical protein C8J57DRAFT_1224358 [Mycena rebaudengoi]|nr:hypothetical protein C8J57DRAFT_1224358 [Mycena rebaudengoi]
MLRIAQENNKFQATLLAVKQLRPADLQRVVFLAINSCIHSGINHVSHQSWGRLGAAAIAGEAAGKCGRGAGLVWRVRQIGSAGEVQWPLGKRFWRTVPIKKILHKWAEDSSRVVFFSPEYPNFLRTQTTSDTRRLRCRLYSSPQYGTAVWSSSSSLGNEHTESLQIFPIRFSTLAAAQVLQRHLQFRAKYLRLSLPNAQHGVNCGRYSIGARARLARAETPLPHAGGAEGSETPPPPCAATPVISAFGRSGYPMNPYRLA